MLTYTATKDLEKAIRIINNFVENNGVIYLTFADKSCAAIDKKITNYYEKQITYKENN